MSSSPLPSRPNVPRQRDKAAQHFKRRGVGLIELMVSLALGLVVSGAVFGLFISNRDVLRTTENLARLHDDARVAFELLARDIREAGGNPCGANAVANVLNNAGNNWWSNWTEGTFVGYAGDTAAPRTFGTNTADRIWGTDAFLVRHGTTTPVIITDHNPASAQFKVNITNHGIYDGDIVMACDSQSAAIFQVTNSNQINRTVVHNTGTGAPGNCSKDLGYPTNCNGNRKERTFAQGGLIAKYQAVFWYIGQNPVGGRSLYRIENNGTPIEMTRDITNLQLQYLTSDLATPPTLANSYTSAANITDWNTVVAVRVTLTHQTSERVGTDNASITRQTQYTVSLRNREYLP